MRRESMDMAKEFRELTLRDAKNSLHNELEKLIKTARPEQQTVSIGGRDEGTLGVKGVSCSMDMAKEFRELTLRDAKNSLHNELKKLIKTARPEQQTVSIGQDGGGGGDRERGGGLFNVDCIKF